MQKLAFDSRTNYRYRLSNDLKISQCLTSVVQRAQKIRLLPKLRRGSLLSLVVVNELLAKCRKLVQYIRIVFNKSLFDSSGITWTFPYLVRPFFPYLYSRNHQPSSFFFFPRCLYLTYRLNEGKITKLLKF